MTKRLALLALLAGVLAAVPGPNDHAQAAFPGTNGRIAFVRYSLASPLEEVFMVSPASGLTANLTTNPLISETAPSWSPDGTRVALQRSGPVDGIWVLDPVAKTMSFVPHTDHGFQPAWSPDGDWIAFSRDGGADAELWKVRADGSDLTQLTANADEDREAAWSPDGTRIAFARGGDQDDGLPLHIHTVALADGATSQVTGGKVQDLMPSWQPL
jgi:Tol biopolymer transport system component